ncbi:MAG: cytochrome b/b6 domain-containing protein [Coriobacteriales bacterium]|nr:cytochrome b/b6 domain-containing protein [Coriobacteriales bacterium]
MKETLWFDIAAPLVVLVPFLGLLAAGLSRRTDPVIRGDRILRHDGPARLAHWSHALGTLMLLVSGIILGTRFTPSFVTTSEMSALWFNVHFVFALLFLFGTFYWLGNTLISRHRFREHLPNRHALSSILNHYGSLLHIKGCKMPEEEKYFESERVAFIMALLAAGLVGLSGLVKVAARLVSLPEAFMNATTWVHDGAAALMLLFFLAHIFFGALIPMAWKAFPSMITGYIGLKDAEEEYSAWVRELKTAEALPAREGQSPADADTGHEDTKGAGDSENTGDAGRPLPAS